MEYYIGVDIGTSSTKVLAFSINGTVLASYAVDQPIAHVRPSWSEQDPDGIVRAVINGINEIHDRLAPAHPVFVSFTAAMHSLIAVDEGGVPLTPCMIWADNRAAHIAETLRALETGAAFYHATGVPVHAMTPLSKICWLAEQEPHIFEKAFKFIGIKEYLFFRLFGEYVVDTGIASATGILNRHTLTWDTSILGFAGIGADRLSSVTSVKENFTYIPGKTNSLPWQLALSKRTPFIIGGSDGAAANLGSGASDGRSLVVTIGTSTAARILTRHPETDQLMRTFCYHAKDEFFITGGGGNSGAVVLQWLRNILLRAIGKESDMMQAENYSRFIRSAADAPPGSEGLLFLPYLLGERAPIWNANAKGGFFGLGIHHTREHLLRAVLEGVVFGLYSIGRLIPENGEAGEIYATGGFSNSSLWLQILADTFNREVVVHEDLENSAWGTVLLGMEALGIVPGVLKNTRTVLTPDPANHMIYDRQFRKFERIYALLKDEFDDDPLPAASFPYSQQSD